MRLPLLLAVGLALAGPVLGQTPPPAAQPFRLTDARRAEDLQPRIFSTWMWSCEYAVISMGDIAALGSTGESHGGQTLKGYLVGRFGDRLAGHELIVDRYLVYVNMAATETATSWGVGVSTVMKQPPGGQIGGQTRRAKCPREKMKAGWFDATEITTPYSPFIVEIAGRLDGRAVESRSVYSPEVEMSEGLLFSRRFQSGAEYRAGQAAMDKANIAFGDQIAPLLEPASS